MLHSLRRRDETVESDEALIERALGGEEAALAALYKRYASSVAALVYRMLGCDSDLDDIVQEAFVEMFRSLPSLSDPGKFKPFLMTIAVRRVHARLAWKYRVRGLARRLFGIAPTVSDPEAREPVHALYRSLAGADPRHRIAWVLHRVEGMTLPEAAAKCSISLATAKRWIAGVDAIVEVLDATG